LLGKDFSGREFIIQQNAQNTLSIIKDNWKYIEPGDGLRINKNTRPHIELGNDPLPQLYNLAKDSTEQNNLALENLNKLEELAELLKKIKSGEI
jgi:hypothetical protein